MADNFEFRITGAPLEKSLDIATSRWKRVVGWSVDKDSKRLILYWTDAETYPDYNPLPAPLSGDHLVGFVKSWLTFVDYGREPDIDGECGKGWTVYNESWGHVAGRWQAFVAIEPTWLLYGK